MLSLSNKQIILGITGGIAAYKAAELCRFLIKAGADVRVVMTNSAADFITPLTFQALSGNRVHTELLDEEAEAAMGHIELARWADLILVAPASANFIARLAQGRAEDLLSTLCLASTGTLAVAPAMNQGMWRNTNTQDNLKLIQEKGVVVFGPASGEQACGDTGPGRMQEPADIARAAADLFETGTLAGINITITAGPTREAIDPVRYISNHSSGKMGYALARAAMEAGANVVLISGPVALDPPPRVKLVTVESASQMLDACKVVPGDIFISVAAVADYRPEQSATEKIKKTEETMILTMVKTPDILATLSLSYDRPFCVGFAAETENLEEYACKKLQDKKLDLIFSNNASDTFNSDSALVTAYWNERNEEKNPGKKNFEESTKSSLARDMVALIASRYQENAKPVSNTPEKAVVEK
ncbi:MAG: bifunctional phosphopantothenoylcysteine decarboxylase/phosphopantothenate--cysteine ligase CoaBC [Pseudomonadales bacterium]|jgi:phosphopantothenoylcysteine decarboxylase/phosphopantothenate--cysteine ligase